VTCPICHDEGCHYYQLRLSETWHPPVADRQDGIPADYVRPVWRLRPERHGIAVIALDPREALWVLANGCTLDGHQYHASLEDDGRVQGDGRVQVRIVPAELTDDAYVAVAG